MKESNVKIKNVKITVRIMEYVMELMGNVCVMKDIREHHVKKRYVLIIAIIEGYV